MRFIHIADVHLGARPDAGPLYSENRERELWDTFEYVIRVCENEQDVYKRQILTRDTWEMI